MTDRHRTFDDSFKLQVVKTITEQGLVVSRGCRDVHLVGSAF
ncbi:transposase [Pseudomonas agarici]|nr:transposase [Pseudomonas agarici]